MSGTLLNVSIEVSLYGLSKLAQTLCSRVDKLFLSLPGSWHARIVSSYALHKRYGEAGAYDSFHCRVVLASELTSSV